MSTLSAKIIHCIPHVSLIVHNVQSPCSDVGTLYPHQFLLFPESNSLRDNRYAYKSGIENERKRSTEIILIYHEKMSERKHHYEKFVHYIFLFLFRMK